VTPFSGQDGKYLLARHTYPIGESRHEVWGIPGGTVDRYENIKETIRREVSQELGLAISVGKLLLVDVSLAPRLDFFFECHVLDGEFRPSSEVAEIGYFDLEAPPDGIAGRHLRLMKAFSAGCEETHSASPALPPAAHSRPRPLPGLVERMDWCEQTVVRYPNQVIPGGLGLAFEPRLAVL